MSIFKLLALSLIFSVCLISPIKAARAKAAELDQYFQHSYLIERIKSTMLSSIRTSWEQGTAAGAIIETDNPQYSVFADNPFQWNGYTPVESLRLGLSAAVRQTRDGRLSQNINDAEDAAALDGASAGSAVLLGSFTQESRKDYWKQAAEDQLDFLMDTVNRTSNGALSMRVGTLQIWADGVYMAPPFLAYYGAVTKNQSLIQFAYDNCRLYREALLLDGPTGPLFAHIYDDDNKNFTDAGLWGSGNAWGALGMIRVAATIHKSEFADVMSEQMVNLAYWVKEIFDGEFAAMTNNQTIPDYVPGKGLNATWGDASASATLTSVAYRGAKLFPHIFTPNYTEKAAVIRDAVLAGIDPELGLLSPVVDPLIWDQIGILSTEGQAFGLMMFAAWKDWLGL